MDSPTITISGTGNKCSGIQDWKGNSIDKKKMENFNSYINII